MPGAWCLVPGAWCLVPCLMAQAGPGWLHGHGGEVVGGVRLAEGAASSRADAFKSIAFTALPD